MTQVIEYMVVENAGYVGERDVRAFRTLHEAQAYLDKHYDRRSHERERLHVAVRRDVNGVGEYV